MGLLLEHRCFQRPASWLLSASFYHLLSLSPSGQSDSSGTTLLTGTEETDTSIRERSTEMLTSSLKTWRPASSGGASDGTHGAMHLTSRLRASWDAVERPAWGLAGF